jgi:amidohydrolase
MRARNTRAIPGEGRPSSTDWVADYLSNGLSPHVDKYIPELIELRRRLHARPEVAHKEFETSKSLQRRLDAAGLELSQMPGGTGFWCDLESPTSTGMAQAIALRADFDALPVNDEKNVPYRSTIPGVAHACGHDAHAAILLGAGLVLNDLTSSRDLPNRTRLIFQHAEEVGEGAKELIQFGVLDNIRQIYALHCYPQLAVGNVGLRKGPIASGCDFVELEIRPSNTGRRVAANVVHAWATISDLLCSALSHGEPKGRLSIVWGHVSTSGAGDSSAPEAIVSKGTVRTMNRESWDNAPQVFSDLTNLFAEAQGVTADITYVRGTPLTINDGDALDTLARAAEVVLGRDAIVEAEQSLGGEDFGYYVTDVPGAYARLGVGWPGHKPAPDLHHGSFDIDEDAIGVGVRLLVATALLA